MQLFKDVKKKCSIFNMLLSSFTAHSTSSFFHTTHQDITNLFVANAIKKAYHLLLSDDVWPCCLDIRFCLRLCQPKHSTSIDYTDEALEKSSCYVRNSSYLNVTVQSSRSLWLHTSCFQIESLQGDSQTEAHYTVCSVPSPFFKCININMALISCF